MSIQTNCPNCEASYTLAESQRGKKVRCRKCSETFVVGESDGANGAAKSGKFRKDALQASPRPPARTPPPKTNQAVRRGRDRDRDDDDFDDEPVVRKKSGSAMPMILLIGGGLVVLFLLCGGGAMVAVYYWTSTTVANGVDNITQNIPNNPGAPNDPFAPNPGIPFGQPVFVPADASEPKDLSEALDWVKNGATVDKKNKAADWLGKAAVEDARQKEVAAALRPLVGNPTTHDAGVRGLANWAGPEDGPTLVKAADDDKFWQWGKAGGEAADALVRLQEPLAAPVFARRLETGEHAAAAQRLGQLGKVAEKEVLKYMDSPKNEAHTEAVKLLKSYGTAPETMVNQAIADLQNVDPGYHRWACDYLATAPVQEARRDEVSKALEVSLRDNDGATRDNAAKILKVWGAKDNVPALIGLLESDPPFYPHFVPARDALVALNDERGATAIAKYLSNLFKHEEAAKGLRDMGPLAVKGVVNNLDSRDNNERKAACEFLGNQMTVDETVQKQAARGLDKLLDDTTDGSGGVRQAAAKAEVVWADKDSVPSLVKAMVKDNSDVWQQCLEALTRLKDDRAVIPMLAIMSKHANDVDKAFEEMGPAVVEPVFDNLLNDPTTNLLVRRDLCALIAKYGTKASLPALQTAAKSNNPVIKTAAATAITTINAKP